jgi:acetyl esterase/lipase
MKLLITITTCLSFIMNSYAQVQDTIRIWPGEVPGETAEKHVPVFSPNRERNVTRIAEVTDPAIVVYEASAANSLGAGVVVCPGGGYNILAVDLEGYEIAEWLNSLGFTAFVLQYRVPRKQEGALQDVQRAFRLIRSRAEEWNIDPDRLGVLGFSAGGSLSARASTRYDDTTYEPVDAADTLSCRPDFSVLIYPAYLDQGENRALTPELKVNENTPPMFIFATADDQYGNSALVMTTALRDHKVPVELHFLAEGGHGYGLRPGNVAAATWPPLAAQWLKKIITDGEP